MAGARRRVWSTLGIVVLTLGAVALPATGVEAQPPTPDLIAPHAEQVLGHGPAGTASAAQAKAGGRSSDLDDRMGVAAADSRVTVEVVLDGDEGTAAAVRAAVARSGGVVLGGVADLIVEAEVTLETVSALEELPGVELVREPVAISLPPMDPDPVEGAGASAAQVAGQETSLMNVAAWHTAGHTGQGVKIGIVDYFSTAAWNAAQTAGEVPAVAGSFCRLYGASCNAFTVTGTGQTHGTAVAEIIHEQAPSAQIYVAFAESVSDLQAAVDYFAAQGVTIVSRSLSSKYDGPGNGTGPLAAVIDDAVASGMLFVNSAGNSAGVNGVRSGSYWRGAWVDTNANNYLEFATGDEFLQVGCGSSGVYSYGFRWSDWGANPTDYDVYFVDGLGNTLSSSRDDQPAGAPPIEDIAYPGCPASGLFMVVHRYAAGGGSAGDVLEYQVNGTGLERWQNPYSGAVGVADSASPGAMSVGAVDPAAGTTIAPYSSWGPTNDGRIKPDVSAPACMTSFTYSPSCFNGTSAATPAVAGAAAVIKGAGVANTPAQLKTYLRASVVDRGAAGADNVYGSGQVLLPTLSAGGWFHPLTPARIQDSRPSGPQVGPYGTPWGGGTTRTVQVTGNGGVPAGAEAVTLNVTVTGTTAPSYLTIWPFGSAKPAASSLNWAPGVTIPNAVTAKLSASGAISVFNASGSANVIIDVVGYYSATPGGGYTPLTPARIQDSRPSGPQVGPYGTPWGGGTTRTVQVTGNGGVPAGAEAVTLNVTVTGTTAPSYLTIWPFGSAKPAASSLNWAPGVTIPNAVTVKLSASGAISVFNASGNANVIIDVVGYFKSGTGSKFYPLAPARIQDSRPSGPQVGPHGTPWGSGTTRTVQVEGNGGVPNSATSVLANVTATSTTGSSYLTIWPAGSAKPAASSLNWAPGVTIPNAVTAKLNAGGAISMFNAAGSVHLIVDVAGWYG